MTTIIPNSSSKAQSPLPAILSNEFIRSPALDSSSLLGILNNPVTFIKSSTITYPDLYNRDGFDFLASKAHDWCRAPHESRRFFLSGSTMSASTMSPADSGADVSTAPTSPPTDTSSPIDTIPPTETGANSEPVIPKRKCDTPEEQAPIADAAPKLVSARGDVHIAPLPCGAKWDPPASSTKRSGSIHGGETDHTAPRPTGGANDAMAVKTRKNDAATKDGPVMGCAKPESPRKLHSRELGKGIEARLETSSALRKRKATERLEKDAANYDGGSGAASAKKTRRLRVKGIRNPHILCYRNSVLQFISTCDTIRSLGWHHRGDHRNCVLCGLAAFYTDHFRDTNQSPGVNMSVKELASFKKAMPPPFNRMSGRQEDAFEYLMALLATADQQLTEKFPNVEENNLIRRVFGGCYPTALECTNCRHKSASPEDSTVLQLGPLHVRNRSEVIHLIDKLKEVFRAEAVEWRCEKCGANVGRKRKTISVAPEYLVINIPRHKPFAWETSGKVKNRVSFGETLRLPVGGSSAHYELASVVAHAGSDMTSGHYIAYVRQPDHTWASCNDDQVEQVSWDRVSTCSGGSYQACILGYRKK